MGVKNPMKKRKKKNQSVQGAMKASCRSARKVAKRTFFWTKYTGTD